MDIDIIWLGGIITAVSSLLGVAWKLHTLLNRMEKKFEQYDKTINENTIHILRMTLLSDDLPITDRINAGKLYIELGGNGYGHVVYDKLIEELKQNDIHHEPPKNIK